MFIMSAGNSITEANDYRLVGWGLILNRDRDCFFLHHIQKGPGAQLASYVIKMDSLFLGVNWRELDNCVPTRR
jgi:hypothetical protein